MKFLDGEIEILKEKIREVQRRVEEIASKSVFILILLMITATFW